MRKWAGVDYWKVLRTLGQVAIVIVFVSVTLSGEADAQGTGGRRVALVVGNASYVESPLSNPINDARAMADALKKRGFEVILRENTSKLDLERAVSDFGEKLQQGATGLFYYAGHGMQVNGRNFLVPVDARIPSEQRVRLEAVDVDLVLEQMQAARSAVNLIILDACRNNPFEKRFRSGGGSGLAQINAPEGTLIAYATAPGSVAADGSGRNSIYTEELLKAMQAQGAKVEEVFKTVRVAVSRRTKGAQTPWEASSLIGDFFFVPPVESKSIVTGLPPSLPAPVAGQTSVDAAPNRVAMELAFWESIKGSTSIPELKAYLTQFPDGTFAPLVRAKIEQLTPKLSQKPGAASIPAPSSPIASPIGGTPPAQANRTVGISFRDCAECPELIAIPAGNFSMGVPVDEEEREKIPQGMQKGRSLPLHQLAVRHFALGKFEVTRSEFSVFVAKTGHQVIDKCFRSVGGKQQEVSGLNWRTPGFPQSGRDPVVCVAWEDAKAYVAWLSKMTGLPYRLASEAEWEYAARAGKSTARSWGDSIGSGHANCSGCGSEWDNKQPAPVGSFRANSYGLHDLLGNVWEWTEDCWNKSYAEAPLDGSAWTKGECNLRILRGGSFSNDPWFLRSGFRGRGATNLRSIGVGFRVARSL